MKRQILPIFLFLFFIGNYDSLRAQVPSYLQPQNREWAFGGSGFNFNNDTLTLLHTTVTSSSTDAGGLASVCDAAGKLLFYTDGYGIYVGNPAPGNNNDYYMPNAYPIINYTFNISPVGMPSGIGYEDTILYYPAWNGSVIVPMIDSPGKYYVFTNERNLIIDGEATYDGSYSIDYYGPCSLFYSVVDMSLNNGYGDVEPGRKGIPVDSLSVITNAIEAIPGDDCNVWLLTHDLQNTYKAYDITSTGINPVPITSTGANTNLMGITGYCDKILSSPNRRKLVAAGPIAMEVSDFDPATGIVSNSVFQHIDSIGNTIVPSSILSLSARPVISPDNTKLYIINEIATYAPGTSYIMLNGFEKIVQYDLSTPGPWASVIIDTTLTYDKLRNLDCARLGPDGKIYIKNLRVIDYPDSAGTACHIRSLPANLANPFGTGPLGGWWTYPSIVPVLSNHDTVVTTQQSVTCFSDTFVTMVAHDTTGWNYAWSDYNEYRLHTYHRQIDTSGVFVLTYNTPGCQYHIDSFIVKYIAPYTVNLGPDTIICNNSSFSHLLLPHDTVLNATYLWQDGSSDSAYVATSIGTYWVKVTDTAGCNVSDTMHIEGINLNVNLGNDTTLCIDKPIQFSLQVDSVAGASYLWSTGSTATTINIQDTGIYWIAVVDTPCAAGDTIDIQGAYCECAFGMPNAFTPNGDGKNDVFRPVLPPGCPVAGYLLTIYNRWGQMVFSSTNVAQGWDGTFKGIPADIDTYEYVVQFEAGTSHEQHYQKGDLTLIR